MSGSGKPAENSEAASGLIRRNRDVMRPDFFYVRCAAQAPKSTTTKTPPDGGNNSQVYRQAQALAKRIQAADSVVAEWDSLFLSQSESPADAVILETVVLLHERRQFEAAVEGLQSAIRNNHAAAWMYDVLAIEMKLAGRPAGEIARVLDSRTDFATSDIGQMLVTAALMSRFEAWDQAFRVCQEASELNPESPDVWMLSRSISDKSGSRDFRTWSRCGILKHVWTSDFEALHAEAKQVLESLAAECDRNNQSAAGQEIRKAAAEAQAIDLQIFLRWVGAADLDLMITEPDGQVCDFRQRMTRNSGRLIREASVGDQRKSGVRHEEHYVCHSALAGEYRITTRFVLGKVPSGTAQLEIIHHAGSSNETRIVQTITLGREDVVQTTVLSNGRAEPAE